MMLHSSRRWGSMAIVMFSRLSLWAGPLAKIHQLFESLLPGKSLWNLARTAAAKNDEPHAETGNSIERSMQVLHLPVFIYVRSGYLDVGGKKPVGGRHRQFQLPELSHQPFVIRIGKGGYFRSTHLHVIETRSFYCAHVFSGRKSDPHPARRRIRAAQPKGKKPCRDRSGKRTGNLNYRTYDGSLSPMA